MKTRTLFLLVFVLVFLGAGPVAAQQAAPPPGQPSASVPQPYAPSAKLPVGPSRLPPTAMPGSAPGGSPYLPSSPFPQSTYSQTLPTAPTFEPTPLPHGPTETGNLGPLRPAANPYPTTTVPPVSAGNPYRSPQAYSPTPAPTTAYFSHPVYGPFVPSSSPASYQPPGFGTVGAGPAPAALGQKPFADYTPPPAISPYMNLYRFNPGTFLPNYNLYVQPILQQNATNQSFGNQLQGLENTTRFQGSALDLLDQRTNALQGTYQPGYFMNYGGYYQNLQR